MMDGDRLLMSEVETLLTLVLVGLGKFKPGVTVPIGTRWAKQTLSTRVDGGNHVRVPYLLDDWRCSPGEDGALFLSERFPMANRSFICCQIWPNNVLPTLSASILFCSGQFPPPSTAVASCLQIQELDGSHYRILHFVRFSDTHFYLIRIEGIFPPCEFGPHMQYPSHTWT